MRCFCAPADSLADSSRLQATNATEAATKIRIFFMRQIWRDFGPKKMGSLPVFKLRERDDGNDVFNRCTPGKFPDARPGSLFQKFKIDSDPRGGGCVCL